MAHVFTGTIVAVSHKFTGVDFRWTSATPNNDFVAVPDANNLGVNLLREGTYRVTIITTVVFNTFFGRALAVSLLDLNANNRVITVIELDHKPTDTRVNNETRERSTNIPVGQRHRFVKILIDGNVAYEMKSSNVVVISYLAPEKS